jgi:two-component system response regulator DesR
MAAVADVRPAVAVIDVDLPAPAGWTGLARLRERTAECVVVMLADRGEPAGVRCALTVDPLGLLSRQAAADILTRVIRQVAAGRPVIDPEQRSPATGSRSCGFSGGFSAEIHVCSHRWLRRGA